MRKANEDDVPLLSQLYKKAGLLPAGGERQVDEDFHSSFCHDYVIELPEKGVVGAVRWEEFNRCLGGTVNFHLSFIAIDHKLQNGGLGERLFKTSLKKIEQQIKRQGLNLGFYIVVALKEKEHFYKEMGMEIVGSFGVGFLDPEKETVIFKSTKRVV